MLAREGVEVPRTLLQAAEDLGKRIHGHHIVMKGRWYHRRAVGDALEESRRILKNAGIDDPVKDLRNLTFSLNWDHGVDYAQSVMRRLQAAEAEAATTQRSLSSAVDDALSDIKKVLHRGRKYRFP